MVADVRLPDELEGDDLSSGGSSASSSVHHDDIVHRLLGSVLETDAVDLHIRQVEKCEDNWLLTGAQMDLLVAVVRSTQFDLLIGVFIVLNICMMAIQGDRCSPMRYDPDRPCPVDLMSYSEHFFVFLFVFEFYLRLVANGVFYYIPRKFTELFDPSQAVMWNFIDASLVWVVGVTVTWILPLVNLQIDVFYLQTLRLARLVRLIRVMRLVPAFRPLWLLVRGVMCTAPALVWALVLTLILSFCFALIGIQITDPYFEKHQAMGTDRYVDGMAAWMFFLMQIMTCDSWSGVARTMLEVQPGWPLLFFIIFFIALGMFVLLNLVMAMIMDTAMILSKDSAADLAVKLEKEMVKKVQKLKEFFINAQAALPGQAGGDDHTITEKEFMKSLETPQMIEDLAGFGIDPHMMKTLYHLLDNGDGEVSWREFREGMNLFLEAEISNHIFVKLKAKAEQLTGFLVTWYDEVHASMNGSGGIRLEKSDLWAQALARTMRHWFINPADRGEKAKADGGEQRKSKAALDREAHKLQKQQTRRDEKKQAAKAANEHLQMRLRALAKRVKEAEEQLPMVLSLPAAVEDAVEFLHILQRSLGMKISGDCTGECLLPQEIAQASLEKLNDPAHIQKWTKALGDDMVERLVEKRRQKLAPGGAPAPGAKAKAPSPRPVAGDDETY